jgi:hypothetical protein
MADIITITPQPIRFTTASYTSPGVLQPIYLSTDIGGYDFMDIEAGVVSNEGTVTAFTLDLYTGMQVHTDDGWVKVGNSLITTATVPTWATTNIPNGLLRYVRWRVTTITVGTAMTFFIRGMGRRYA